MCTLHHNAFLPALQKLEVLGTKATELDKNVGHLISWRSRWDILEIGGQKWNTAHNPPALEKKNLGAFRKEIIKAKRN